jgi:predicted nucleic acid-binding protein
MQARMIALRLVVDTNIIVSAALKDVPCRSPPLGAIRAIARRALTA